MTRTLDVALGCAARGWHVFPVRCRSKKPPAFPDHTAANCTGRDPRCRNGHVSWEARATADTGRIRRGWATGEYNVGIATGPSGLVVVDLDQPKPGEAPPARWAGEGVTDGADVLAALCEQHGEPFPWETMTARTPSGGMHLYFTAPPGAGLRNSAGGLGWLVDTRACGGYVIAPGCEVDRGGGSTGRYELLYDRPPAPLPGWLASLLMAPQAAAGSVPPQAGTVTDLPAYVRKALQGEGDRIREATEGERTFALNKAGYCLGRLIGAGALPEDVAEAALMDAATVHFGADRPVTPAEARASVRGGIAAGKRRPRTLGGAA